MDGTSPLRDGLTTEGKGAAVETEGRKRKGMGVRCQIDRTSSYGSYFQRQMSNLPTPKTLEMTNLPHQPTPFPAQYLDEKLSKFHDPGLKLKP